MIEGHRPGRSTEAKQSPMDSAWDAVQRIYNDFEIRAHAGLDGSRMRAGDVLRPAIEAVIAVPRAVALILRAALDHSTKRVEDAASNAASALTGAAAEMQKAAQAQRAAAEAQFKADHAKALNSLTERLAATTNAAVAEDRRLRGWRAFGIAGGVALALLGTGMLIERWRASAFNTQTAADRFAELRQETAQLTATLAAERQNLAQAGQDVREAVMDASTGLSFLRTLGQLPEAERAALNTILDELAASVRATGPSPELVALQQALSLKGERRTQAIEFGAIADPIIRRNMLAIAKISAQLNGAMWWEGENVFKGCLAAGPVLPHPNNNHQATCLVAIPNSWGVRSDNNLKNYYITR